MKKDLKELQQAWLDAKAEEDKAKQARLLVEGLILEAIGYTPDDPNIKSWKDDTLKITFGQKEEYDNEALKEIFKPQDWFAPEFPFRIKLEPDAKKMMAFKVDHNQFYLEKLAPLCVIKYSKPSFSAAKGE